MENQEFLKRTGSKYTYNMSLNAYRYIELLCLPFQENITKSWALDNAQVYIYYIYTQPF